MMISHQKIVLLENKVFVGMSRGFVKEGDQEELAVIPLRAPLPFGVHNYVTPNGYRALVKEREDLQNEYKSVENENETEYRHATTFINGKLKLLNERISTAQVLYPADMSHDEVRFGALVEFEETGERKKFQIVGVDEADIREQKIAFTSPIARAVTGKRIGETAVIQLRGKTRRLKILSISYTGDEDKN